MAPNDTGLLLLANGSGKRCKYRAIEFPQDDSMIDLRLPKNVEEPKHHIGYLMCTVQVPLIGITDAVSMVLWLGLLV